VLYQLSAPTIVHDPTGDDSRFPCVQILGFVGENDFMQLSTSQAHVPAR
jgi:hypothetical protein